MKLKVGIMLVILTTAVALPYFIKGRDGKPLVDFSGNKSLDILSTEQTRQQFHSWQDENGVWHFGDEAPEGMKTKVVKVDTAANIIRSIKVQKKEEEAEGKADIGSPSLSLPGTVSPDKIGEMMENAQNVQQLLDDRAAQMKKINN